LASGFISFYFSLITLTTVGFGDIAPLAEMARMLASLEALTGTLFIAILISRLVAVYSSATSHDQK
jgi:voltage-gated potassium channel Kch